MSKIIEIMLSHIFVVVVILTLYYNNTISWHTPIFRTHFVYIESFQTHTVYLIYIITELSYGWPLRQRPYMVLMEVSQTMYFLYHH